ncbi:hypothetical protein H6P81_003925 [Aristolochia fimbriata]|uniref:Uncharacterized protein n=1 Tax=Aristolochia fimbriata TaxID=158543 RepID=A0AAV7FGW9_ARIFI|nr:hypothetical protein H6P81_003925 [Aristolochia fimbriata]
MHAGLLAWLISTPQKPQSDLTFGLASGGENLTPSSESQLVRYQAYLCCVWPTSVVYGSLLFVPIGSYRFH